MFAFARLEWAAVWCAGKIEPGCIDVLPEKTAGNIARRLVSLAPRAPDGPRNAELLAASERFFHLVDRRNDIVHAKPCEVDGGAQRLSRRGGILTVDVINAAADDFAECEIALLDLFHNCLTRPA